MRGPWLVVASVKVQQKFTRAEERGIFGDAKATHELLCCAWLGQLQPSSVRMGQAQSQRGKGGEFGKGTELPYFIGQVQFEPNFDLPFVNKQVSWVMAHGLYFKQWDPGGVSF